MAIRKRVRKGRLSSLSKKKWVPVLTVNEEDLIMWDKTSGNPMFGEALKELRSLKGQATVKWRRGAKSLEVIPHEKKPSRKRVREKS